MKKLLPCFFILLTLHSFSQSKNDETAIRRILNEQTIAWNNGDLESFMKAYWVNDSLMFIGKNGIKYGWNNTLNNYKTGYPDTISMGKLNFNILFVKPLSPEYYHVTGKWFLKRSIGDLTGYFTLVFRKIKGTWLIVADHSS